MREAERAPVSADIASSAPAWSGSPELRFVVPPGNENRWSDLLACLIATDPTPMGELLGVQPDEVRREEVVSTESAEGGVGGRRSDRLDLLLLSEGVQIAAIEVKLLSDLGPRQLDRYAKAFPCAHQHLVLHFAGFPVNIPPRSRWHSLTWETVLSAYAASNNDWVASTARAWTAQLGALSVPVDSATLWNAVPDEVGDFELALRARVAWLARRLDEWCQIDHDLLQSTGGGNWVARMWINSARPGYVVTAEIQEGLPSMAWRFDPAKRYADRVVGPRIMIGLRQDGINTSAGYDWSLLGRLFEGHVLGPTGSVIDGRAWQQTAASPKHATDRANWQAMVQAGTPRWIGKGYGMAEATKHGTCVFGARYDLGPSVSLGETETELCRVEALLKRLASVC